MDKAKAVASVQEIYGEIPPGHHLSGQRVGDSTLWTVFAVDEHDRPYPGGNHLVGADGRVWAISSNPGIHDSDLAMRSIQALYEAGVTDRVNDEQFSARLVAETQRRASAIPDLVAAVVAGSFRTSRPTLP